MVDNCPPKGNNCTGPPDFLLLTRDPNSGALSNTGKLMGQNNVSDVSGLLSFAFDNTGKYFVAWTVNNTSTSSASQITVYSVDYTQQTLTPVKSYDTANQGTVTTLPPVAFAFDSTNSFLYVLESSDENEQPQAVGVYSFDQSNGALSQLQVQPLASGHFAGGMVVDDSFVYVIDTLSGSNASVIYVLPHDATGKVSAPVVHPGRSRASPGQWCRITVLSESLSPRRQEGTESRRKLFVVCHHERAPLARDLQLMKKENPTRCARVGLLDSLPPKRKCRAGE